MKHFEKVKILGANVGDWEEILTPVLDSQLAVDTLMKIEKEYISMSLRPVPSFHHVWRAFDLCKPKNYRCIILGIEPYTDGHSATGLAFGIPQEQMHIPPNLKNIISELERSYDSIALDFDYSLESWAKQGVLLLNASLTGIQGSNGKHVTIWKKLMSSIIDHIVGKFPYHPILVFGRKSEDAISDYARTYSAMLYSPHPAAAAYGKSAGAIGSDIFIKANGVLADPKYLVNKPEVDWLYGNGFESMDVKDVPF